MKALHVSHLHYTLVITFICIIFSACITHAEEADDPTAYAPAIALQPDVETNFMLTLPQDLTVQQKKSVEVIFAEFAPKLKIHHARLIQIMSQLHLLSFAEDTPQDALITLGAQLVQTRDALMEEMNQLNGRLQHEVGITPMWSDSRGCNQWSESSIPRD